jgi:hypothetical protein
MAVGRDKYNTGDRKGARESWSECSEEINRAQSSTFWTFFVSGGEQPFLDAIAELQFTACLNVAQFNNTVLGTEPGSWPASDLDRRLEFSFINHSYVLAEKCMEPDFWRPVRTWRPSNIQLAKLRY